MTLDPKALEVFTAYFVKNYPGPDTIIHDPKWHAPRVLRAAVAAVNTSLPADVAGLVVQIEDRAHEVYVYGTAAQVGPSAEELRQIATALTALSARVEAAEERVKELEAALRELIPMAGAGAMDSHDPRILSARAALASIPTPAEHSDDLAVDRFASAMKTKLAKKRAEGRGGWEGPTCSAELLSNLLRKHVEKGDPLDVGNLAMMLHQRGDRISTASALAAEARREALEEAAKHLSEIANAMWERCEVQRPADPTEISHGEKEDATTAWCFDKAAAAIRALANPARREGE